MASNSDSNSDKVQTSSKKPVVAANAGLISCELLESGIAIITLGAPEERVVTLTEARLRSLKSALEKLASEKPRGLVLIGPAAEMFTAGADINLIKEVTDPVRGEAMASEGQAIFNLLESLPFPSVAAISGPCVGGGCEMALACTYRIISDHKSSVIGLPETKLGILPGFGGTQRLPRLVGLPKALDIILAGKTLKPRQAISCGLVDEIVETRKLRERAEAIALGTSTAKRKSLKLADKFLTFTSWGRSIVRKKAEPAMKKETKGFYPAQPAALDCVFFGLESGQAEGYKREARELGRLIVTPESKALVKVFFLTESSKGLGKSARKAVEHIHAVVVGAGVMGAGIAGVLAKNDCNVILRDTTDQAITRAQKQIQSFLEKLKYLSETERSFILNRIEYSSRETASTGNANFAIEAVFEDLDVKRKILAEIAKQMPEEAIVATNTSSLSVTEIAKAIDHPERVIGMHFFNPVEKMPLVEIVSGQKTSDKTIVTVAALTSKLGKYPIVVQDVPGFLINRILSPYLNEAAYLLSEGYAVSDIDFAATSFGMPMGPLRLLDEVGLDVASHVSEIMIKGYGKRMEGPGYAKTLVASDRKGKKNKKGFYDFGEQGDQPHSDLAKILEIKVARKHLSDYKPLTERLILTLVNEAVRCLDEGVAGRPGPEAAAQIDLGTVMGIGFPPFRGGLLHYAQTLGAKAIFEKLEALEKTYGLRYQPAEGIKLRAKSGRSLLDKI